MNKLLRESVDHYVGIYVACPQLIQAVIFRAYLLIEGAGDASCAQIHSPRPEE